MEALKAAEASRRKEAQREAEKKRQREQLKKQKADRMKHALQVKVCSLQAFDLRVFTEIHKSNEICEEVNSIVSSIEYYLPKFVSAMNESNASEPLGSSSREALHTKVCIFH